MKKGWFKIPGVQDGDRTIEEQMNGLGFLRSEIQGKTVIDFGCAEGLVGDALVSAGARRYVGVDSVISAIETAKKIVGSKYPDAAEFHCDDLNRIEDADVADATEKMFDVCLALAIFHKLRRPEVMMRYVGRITRSLIVARLPAKTPGFVNDPRSGSRVVHLHTEFGREWILERRERGHLDEWIGYYRRSP